MLTYFDGQVAIDRNYGVTCPAFGRFLCRGGLSKRHASFFHGCYRNRYRIGRPTASTSRCSRKTFQRYRMLSDKMATLPHSSSFLEPPVARSADN